MAFVNLFCLLCFLSWIGFRLFTSCQMVPISFSKSKIVITWVGYAYTGCLSVACCGWNWSHMFFSSPLFFCFFILFTRYCFSVLPSGYENTQSHHYWYTCITWSIIIVIFLPAMKTCVEGIIHFRFVINTI